MTHSKKLVFGIGTGRSGTYSLASLLNSQQDASVTHEMSFCPWKPSLQSLAMNLSFIEARPESLVGDVGFYYLNYIPMLLNQRTARIICLKRNKDEVVESWFNHSGPANHWTFKESPHWKAAEIKTNNSLFFPKYDLSKRDAIAQYWEDYYHEAHRLILEYPLSFRIFRIETLSTQPDEILDFIGIEPKNQVIQTFHLNDSGKPFISHTPMPYRGGRCELCGSEDSAEWYLQDEKLGWMTYACNDCKKNPPKGWKESPQGDKA